MSSVRSIDLNMVTSHHLHAAQMLMNVFPVHVLPMKFATTQLVALLVRVSLDMLKMERFAVSLEC